MLTRAHRTLIAVVVTGAVIIAGIGFAGSYAAVRDLAAEKGFGTFAYVFPVGVDAGICVLLALDLLLTWTRIPFPLLRQTAWLLTAATIAFNSAAAWPDPLGVGMHAVIPILFIVAVEAARHAIGRIADITADKHIEGVRLTRWILSPLPTFVLWRRMKLWELRSYEQVIRLEQERLVYQARLRSRFGRAWRRTAPVEALIPLRLARYGVPLAQTAPAGLAAAGIDTPPILFTAERLSVPAPPESSALEAPPHQQPQPAPRENPEVRPAQAPAAVPKQPRERTETAEEDAERFTETYQAFVTQFQAQPTSAQWALWLRDLYGNSTEAGAPLSEKELQPLLPGLHHRHALSAVEATDVAEPHAADESWNDSSSSAWHSHADKRGDKPDAAAQASHVCEPDATTGADGSPLAGQDVADIGAAFQKGEFDERDPTSKDSADPVEQPAHGPLPQERRARAAPVGAAAQSAAAPRGPRVDAPVDEPPPASNKKGGLTAPDRYYLAWMAYQEQKGSEPSDKELSAYCADRGLLGRGNHPVSPANLRRHFLRWRVYNIWAEQRAHTQTPAACDLAQACAERGITGQHNKPITSDFIAEEAADFERRWQSLTRHRTEPHP
ncbi:DUF2637 domain-containing protein [Streptomyces sp. IBSBF 2806]|uniref:DUF2637 domain-containing protein n=1 Tax=Streptomyces sp. IBSBF 2806 TaxID=2903529 RepID=UPI002FDBBF99